MEQPDNTVGFVGNRTECALLMMLRKWDITYKEVRSENESKVGCLSSLLLRLQSAQKEICNQSLYLSLSYGIRLVPGSKVDRTPG